MPNVVQVEIAGPPRIVGTDRRNAGCLKVELPIEPRPPTRWFLLFEKQLDLEVFGSRPPDERPKARADVVAFSVPDARLGETVEAAERQVDATNDAVERFVREAYPWAVDAEGGSFDLVGQDGRRVLRSHSRESCEALQRRILAATGEECEIAPHRLAADAATTRAGTVDEEPVTTAATAVGK